jgi:hypothetical protein
VVKAYNCWMLNWWYIILPVGFIRLIEPVSISARCLIVLCDLRFCLYLNNILLFWNFCCVKTNCFQHSIRLSRHERFDVFHVMIIIFNVLLLFYGYMHLYSVPQPLSNCVSSSIIVRVCVCVFFQSDMALCLQCTYTLSCFYFFICFCSLPSIYCAAHVPHSSAILLCSRVRHNKDIKWYRQLDFM